MSRTTTLATLPILSYFSCNSSLLGLWQPEHVWNLDVDRHHRGRERQQDAARPEGDHGLQLHGE